MTAKSRQVVRPQTVKDSLELIEKTLKGLLKNMDPADEEIWKAQGFSWWGRNLDIEDLKRAVTRARSRMIPKAPV